MFNMQLKYLIKKLKIEFHFRAQLTLYISSTLYVLYVHNQWQSYDSAIAELVCVNNSPHLTCLQLCSGVNVQFLIKSMSAISMRNCLPHYKSSNKFNYARRGLHVLRVLSCCDIPPPPATLSLPLWSLQFANANKGRTMKKCNFNIL